MSASDKIFSNVLLSDHLPLQGLLTLRPVLI